MAQHSSDGFLCTKLKCLRKNQFHSFSLWNGSHFIVQDTYKPLEMIKGCSIRFHFFFIPIYLRVRKESGGFRQIYFLCSGFNFWLKNDFRKWKSWFEWTMNNVFEQKAIEIKHKILLSVPDTRWYSFGNWTRKRLTSHKYNNKKWKEQKN